MFSLEKTQEQSTDFPWSHYWLSTEGKKALLYYRQESIHLLRIPGLADFRISENLRDIFCYPTADIPLETIRHLLLDCVLPRCLAHEGKLMVHGSAVRLDRGILIFIGDSGRGKSTLAGVFHQAGHPVIADDVVWLKEDQSQQAWAVPGYGGLRLWEDSLKYLFSIQQSTQSMAHYSSKQRVLLKPDDLSISRENGPVLAVIALAPLNEGAQQNDIVVEPLSRRDAFIEIIYESFQLDPNDLRERTTRMQNVGQIVAKLRVFRSSTPRNYDLLPIARQKILEMVL